MKKFGALSSSTDPSQLAATIQGLIISFSSIIIFIGALKGIPVTEAGVASFAQQAGATAGAIGTAIGGIVTIYGLVRKIIVMFFSKN